MRNEGIIIIGEIGVNHNGSLLNALKLIDAAKDAGADIVKFQKRNIDRVYSPSELEAARESPWGKTFREQKQGLELSKEAYDEIDRHCKEVGIDWMASAWDVDSQVFLERYNLKYNKVASAMLTHEALLNTIAEAKKHTFISTGMSTLQEIKRVVEIFESTGCPYELMHCNSQYPMPEERANLERIRTLRNLFMCPVGYSCHATGILPPALSVAFGASSIEKHITLDRASYGSDQAASVEPHGFKKMVEYIRCAEKCIGNGEIFVTEEEEKIKKKLRRNHDYQK